MMGETMELDSFHGVQPIHNLHAELLRKDKFIFSIIYDFLILICNSLLKFTVVDE